MHILIIPSWYPETPSDISGCFFREQAVALVRAGCKVGVIYPQRRAMRAWYKGKFGIREELDQGVSTLRKYGVRWLSLIPGVQQFLWLHDGLRLYRNYVTRHGVPDLVHAHSIIYGGVLAYRIFQRFDLPYVITEHSSVYAFDLLTGEQKSLAVKAASHAARRLAVSNQFCELLGDYFNGESGAWEPLPNIVNYSFFEYPLNQAEKKHGEFSFICVAMLLRNKGIYELVAAFARAFEGNKNVKLLIGGDGVERDSLELLVKKLRLEHRVKFLGLLNREEVKENISRADVFVSPSYYETFGVAIAEAMALGKPVIATRCGGPESIVSEQDGLLVQPRDVDSLSAAMIKMRNEFHKFNAAEIRQSSIRRYGEKAVNAQLVKVYRGVLEPSYHAIGDKL